MRRASVFKENRHQLSTETAAVERNVTLPEIGEKYRFDYSPYRSAASRVADDHCSLPLISNTGRRMESSSTPSDLRVVLYDTMEQRRAHKIGVKPLRNFNVTRSVRAHHASARHSLPPVHCTPSAPQLQPLQSQNDGSPGLSRSNSIAPFTTMAPKSTCGFYFNRETVNKKVRIGVPPSDLVKWRSDYSQFPQKQA